MLIQAERPASRGCVCWVLIPHPELPAAGELTAGQTYVCWGRPAESLFHTPPHQSVDFRPAAGPATSGDPHLLLAGPASTPPLSRPVRSFQDGSVWVLNLETG